MRSVANTRNTRTGVLTSGFGSPDSRRALAVVAAVYVAALVVLPWLPPPALLVATLAAAIGLWYGWTRSGRPRNGYYAAAPALPLHLLVLASGGLASPLLPLFLPWIVLVAFVAGFAPAASAGAGVAFLLLVSDLWGFGLRVSGLLEAGVVILGGLLPAWLQQRMREGGLVRERELERIREEARLGRVASETVEAARRLDNLGETLERMRRSLGASRAILWDVDAEADRARPRIARGGSEPRSIPLSGDPLRWAWEEGLPLRLETPPLWADGAARACIVPLEPGGTRAALFSVEFEAGSAFPTVEALEEASGQLRALLQLQAQEALTVAARERMSRVLDLLGRLARTMASDTYGAELAASAVELVGASGGTVAVWENGEGRIIATVGDDGGPAVGTTFGDAHTEMALAARYGTTLFREQRRAEGKPLPIASSDERWVVPPRSLAVVPLPDPGRGVIGVLACWSIAHDRLDGESVQMLETIAPYLALQLRNTLLVGDLREHAERDPLTGLRNRRAFEAIFEREAAEYRRYGRPLSLVILDIDHFKQVNDTWGHEAGDAALRAVGALLEAAVREVDIAARFGGEEFVVLLPETTMDGAKEFAERLRRRVEDEVVTWKDQVIPLSVSLGVSAVPECVTDPAELLQSADAALYQAKIAGRNRVVTATSAG